MKEDIDLLVEAHQIHDTWLTKNGGYARDKTLRDEFAMWAMQGIVSHKRAHGAQWHEIPKHAYDMADAMLKAREGK